MCCRLESSWDQRGSCAGSLTATLLAASPAAPLSQALLPPVGSAWRDSSSSRVCKVPRCSRQLFAPNTASSRSSRYSFRLRICQEHRVALEVRSHGQEQPERFCQASRLLPGSWDHETSLLPQPLNASQHRHAEVRQVRARLRIHGASLGLPLILHFLGRVCSDATHSYPHTPPA